jgi:hypothetical protein
VGLWGHVNGRLIAAAVAVAAVVLEVSLFLSWRVFPGVNFTSIFGSVDREQRFIDNVTSPTSGWSAFPLAGILLTILSAGALGVALLALRRTRPPSIVMTAIIVGAAAGAVFCIMKLLSGRSVEAKYVLRGYGATAYSGAFAARTYHGVGVVLAVIASALIALGVVVMMMLPARGPEPR